MDDRREHETERQETTHVPALVEAQLETARTEVFRAYVRARAKARELADEPLHGDEPPGSA